MKKKMFLLCLLMLLIFFPNVMNSQILHVVELSTSDVFTPANITIDVGDTVRWVNNGGFHNVIADDGSFTSGDPAFNPWVYENVFRASGDNPYYCVIHGNTGGIGMSGVITVQIPTGVASNNIAPNEFELKQNYPNPFNPSTNIQYSVSESGKIKLAVYNLIGEEVALLVNGIVEVGFYEVTFSATKLSGGIYFYRLQTNDYTQTKKMILLK